MKLKRMMLATTAVWMAAQLPVAAQHVEIGTGTSTTSYVPFYGFYDYSWSQAIYLQSEIGSAVQIDGISYYVDNTPSSYKMLNQSVYLKHTTLTSFPDETYDNPSSAGFTQVYNGSNTWNGSGWHEITFDTPFAYNGTDNLIVCWENHDGTYASGYPKFRYTSQSNRVKYKYADGSFPAVSGYLHNYCPNIRLHFSALSGPGLPTSPQPADGARYVATNSIPSITWTNPPVATHNALYFSTSQADVVATNLAARVLYDGATLYTNYTHAADLQPGTTYYWRVLEIDSASNSTLGQVWSFTTEPLPVTTYPWTEGFEHGGVIPPDWTQEHVVDTHDWVFQTGGHCNEQPPTAHSGTYNAAFIHKTTGSKTRLVTPPLDVSADNAQLTFWHVQRIYDGDQDELRVYYKNAPEGAWKLIPGAEYTSHVAD
jgi:hypothetical protein